MRPLERQGITMHIIARTIPVRTRRRDWVSQINVRGRGGAVILVAEEVGRTGADPSRRATWHLTDLLMWWEKRTF